MAEHKQKPVGEWTTEPNQEAWIDAATGYECEILRTQAGNLCGYVYLPPGHPDFGRGRNEFDAIVHGGVTLALDLKDARYAVGFDCGHSCDARPYDLAWSLFLKEKGQEAIYRNFAYVRAECESLARQLKERE